MTDITKEFLEQKDNLVAEVGLEKFLREEMNKDFKVRVHDEIIDIIRLHEQYISISGDIDDPIITLHGQNDYELKQAAAIILFSMREKLTAQKLKQAFGFGGF